MLKLTTHRTCHRILLLRTSRVTARPTFDDRNERSPVVWTQRRSLSVQSSIIEPLHAVRDVLVETINDWAMSYPVTCISTSLCNMHEVTGLPWWAVILGGTALARTIVIFPLLVDGRKTSQRRLAYFMMLTYEIKPKLAAKYGKGSKNYKKNLLAIKRKMVAEQNVHPLRLLMPICFQLSFWMSMSFGLRRIVWPEHYGEETQASITDGHSQMIGEGTLWFQDLTLPDPYFVLPVVLGLSYFANIVLMENMIKKGYDSEVKKSLSAQSKYAIKRKQKISNAISYTIKGLSLSMIYVSAICPSGMSLFWLSSAFMGLGSNLTLASPKFRELVGLKMTPMDSHTPYSDAYRNYRNAWRKTLGMKKIKKPKEKKIERE